MNWLVKKISRKKLDALIAGYGTDAKTLEVGAYGAPSYGRFFPNKIGIDIRPGPGVDMIASAYELPFPDNHFSVVLCLSVMQHMKEPRKAIAEMRRVLKPGGRIVVSVPFLFPICDAPNDYWRFTKFGLQELFSEGWIIETIQAETTIQETFGVLLQRLGYQTKTWLNSVTKTLIFLAAKIVEKMPNLVRKSFGDIHKNVAEPEAFASAFFLVASKK